jgi:formate dehydrogenase assembly factor FdhD
LTVFVDRRELVTLMTLGAAPELLVVGYLRNQRLVDRPRRHRVGDGRLGRQRRGGEDARRHRAIRREDRQARRHDRLRAGAPSSAI